LIPNNIFFEDSKNLHSLCSFGKILAVKGKRRIPGHEQRRVL